MISDTPTCGEPLNYHHGFAWAKWDATCPRPVAALGEKCYQHTATNRGTRSSDNQMVCPSCDLQKSESMFISGNELCVDCRQDYGL